MKIVLYQPDIAGNVGSIIRTCVCFDSEIHIIKPCGFPFDINRVKKSALDYIHHAKIFLHDSFEDFYQKEIISKKQRLVLASTKGAVDYKTFQFAQNDFLMLGRESSGVPQEVFEKSHRQVFIPMKNQMRSLNVAVSCAIILAKAQGDLAQGDL